MAEMLELLDWEFKTAIIIMLKDLVNKVVCKNRCAM